MILFLEDVTVAFMKEEYAGIIDIVISMDCAALPFEMEHVLQV